ncbi:MAG: Hint domain-containing protein [Candidatus Aenigmatarchaeota archaeon]
MCKTKNRAVSAVFLVLISCVLIFISFSSVQAAVAVKVEKAWDCSSGFSCRSDTLGLCTSTLKPYLKMFNNQYSFTLPVDKPAAYKCTITATANHFDFPEGKTDEPNEVTDVSLNGNKIGSTTDSWCQPGSVPCVNPDVCTTCLSYGCTQSYNGDCPNGCSCGCRYTGQADGAIKGGGIALGGQTKVCFTINEALATSNDDKPVVFGFYNPNSRQWVQIRHRGGPKTLETRAGFCFGCDCTNWCGVETSQGDPAGVAGTVYEIAYAKGGFTVTFGPAGGNKITLSADSTVKSLYPGGFDFTYYCIPGTAGCVWRHPYPYAPAGTVTIVDCGGGTTCDNDGICEAGETVANCPNDCTGGCFPAGTSIKMADGSSKGIEDVKKGDMVLSFQNEKIVSSKVAEAYAPIKDYVYLIKTGTSDVKATGEHPFYTGKGVFITADDLKVGDVIYVLKNGALSPEKITSKELLMEPVDVYNLKIEGTETFFADQFAVHNKNPDCFLPGTKILMADGSEKNIEDIKFGDVVMSFEDEKLIPRPVNKIFPTSKDNYILLKTENHEAKVRGTHKFYVGNGVFKRLNDIVVGDVIYVLENSKLVPEKVISKELKKEAVDVYNFEVAGSHTYIANGFAVHNIKVDPNPI